VRVRAKQTSSDRRGNYRGTHRLHPVWSFDIITVSDDRRGKHPVWSTKLIAATTIILDDENGSISVASASAAFFGYT